MQFSRYYAPPDTGNFTLAQLNEGAPRHQQLETLEFPVDFYNYVRNGKLSDDLTGLRRMVYHMNYKHALYRATHDDQCDITLYDYTVSPQRLYVQHYHLFGTKTVPSERTTMVSIVFTPLYTGTLRHATQPGTTLYDAKYGFAITGCYERDQYSTIARVVLHQYIRDGHHYIYDSNPDNHITLGSTQMEAFKAKELATMTSAALNTISMPITQSMIETHPRIADSVQSVLKNQTFTW